ncbi:MAG TPA: hypothetical protein VGP28_09875 [Methylocella sp.]|jgi:hypothetical protein|nr:hypothetical protein [Methylocella sp.]
MIKPLPTGAISLDAAVEMMVRHKCPGPGVILRDDGEDAFRELCKLVLDKRVHPRGQTLDGKTFKAGRDQFIDLQERYIFMAAALRYPAGVEGLGIEDPPSYELFDADGNRYRHARLVFRESEIKTAFGMAAEPLAISAPPPPEKPSPGKASPVLAAVADAEIVELLKEARCTNNMNVAWALVKAKFPGVMQKRFRALWRRKGFGASRGRRPKCVG